jgi:hypothetical protein
MFSFNISAILEKVNCSETNKVDVDEWINKNLYKTFKPSP